MELSLILALKIERDLYAMPRSFERFWKYVAVLKGGTDDIAIPIVGLNPMGHDHCAELLDQLLTLGAEAAAQQAMQAAARRLADVAGRLQVCLVVVDDARGQWTNRYFTEAARLAGQAEVKRNFATVSLWTSQAWDVKAVQREMLACIFRQAYIRRYGAPKTLRQTMAQEGLALYFAGSQTPVLEPDDLEYTRAAIGPYLDSTDFPSLFACLYDDEPARAAGYAPLGLSMRAGYAVAVDAAQLAGTPPESFLVEQL